MGEFYEEEGWEADATEGEYSPITGTRAEYDPKGKSIIDRNGVLLDLTVAYLILGAPVQALRRFVLTEDGRKRPVYVPRDKAAFPDIRDQDGKTIQGSGFKNQRAMLGDNDPAKWVAGDYGVQDPWKLMWFVTIIQPDTMQIYTVQGHTWGMEITVRALKEMIKLRRQHFPPGSIPRVMLQVGVPWWSKKYGEQSRMEFNVVGYGYSPFAMQTPQLADGQTKQIEHQATIIEPQPTTTVEGNGAAKVVQAKFDRFTAEQPGKDGEKPSGKASKKAVPPKGTLAEDLDDDLPF